MAEPRRLMRVPADGRIAGVCAGMSEYLGVDVTVVRFAWIVLTIVPGGIFGGLVAYAAAWVLIPVADTAAGTIPVTRPLTRSVTDRKIGGVCGGVAEYLHVDSTVVRLVWTVLSVVPGGIVMGVLAYVAVWILVPEATGSATTAATHAAA